MKYIYFFFGIFLYLCTPIYGQNYYECGNQLQNENTSFTPKSGTCLTTSSDFINHYSKKETYIPSVGSKEDFIKTIHVSFHIWQRADGTGSLDNTPTNRNRLRQIIQWANGNYTYNASNFSPVPYPTQNISDTKFRLVLDSIYFYRDSTPDSTYFYCKDSYFHNQIYLDPYLKANFPERTKSLSLHLVNGYFGVAAGYSDHGSILSFYRTNPDMNQNNIHDWWYSKHIFHEIGHSLDLWHTYDSPDHWEQGCQVSNKDFLWDVYDTTATRPCNTYFTCDGTQYPTCDVCPLKGGGCVPANNNIMGGNDADFKSALQLGIMHRAVILENQWNSGYNMRNYVTGYNVVPYEITQNETWDFSMKMYQDLVIKSGVILTIQCEVQFVPEAKIVIEPGGKLVIDGGKLTNEAYYNDFWQGIQVYGTTNKNQFPENNPTYQGLLVIKNGGIIENAHKAVTNWHQDSWNEIGGVIQATDAVFRNNRRDVEFISYQNYTPSYTNKYRNLSRFTNTDFVTDDGFIEKGLPIQTHVTMWQVDGITFTNCHFSNDITVNKNNSSSPNRGIYSIDAGYTVGAGCSSLFYPCPTSNLMKSSFNGLGTAIEATGAGTTETVTIQQTDFTNNVWGITISDFDNVSVNRNNINIGDAGYTLFWPLGAGILLENSTGYIVEENKISTNLPQDYRVAINVNNSGTDDNRIYKNDLSNLQVGTQTTGVNYNNINPFLGLQFLCNKYSNNSKGINVTSSSTNDGVRTTQGTINLSSGNTFMNNTLDFDNDANIVFYYHNYGNTQPTYLGNVLPLVSNSTNTCPTSFGGGGVVMKPFLLALDSLNTELDGLSTSYNNLNFTYTSLIDDGNTDQFKDNIELNWSNDAWLLRSELLASSPYLSSEVLLEAAKQNVLPNGMLLEILLANPDATRGEIFINELKEVTNNTFPDYMLDYVRGNYNSRTLRTDMEVQLSAIHSELSNTQSWIKHLTKSKEEYVNSDRLIVANLGDEIYNKVGVMDYYISNGEFNEADSVLSAINSDKKYKTDLALIENFGDYINFCESLGSRNLAQLDSTEIAYLQTLANNKGRVAGYAQNILCFFYDICYEKELPYGNPQNKAMMIPSKNNQEELNNILYNIKIYPNPAKDYASIQWEIYDELKDANYRVIDLNGKEQLNGVLSNNKGEQVLDTRKLKNGVYIIGIYNNNQLKVSKKLIVENQK